MKHTDGTFTGSGGTMLYYQRWLPEEKVKAVVGIVHGLGEHSGRYSNYVTPMVKAGLGVYGMDLRGHGRSEGQRGYCERWEEMRIDVQNYLNLMRSEFKEEAIFLLGHSLGGLTVLNYGLHHPEGLGGIIASAPALKQTAISPVLMAIAKVLSGIVPRGIVKTGLDANGISRDPAVVAAYLDDPLVHDVGTFRMGAEGQKAMDETMAGTERFGAPLLIVHGDADPLNALEGSKEFTERMMLEDKQLIVYPGVYHEAHNDYGHEQVSADVIGWIVRHT